MARRATRARPPGGYRAAENRILWTGDAGLGASLDDMIAWERHIDATRDDADALYSRLSAPATYADGAPAAYGFGLNRRSGNGPRRSPPMAARCAAGAAIGLYMPSERVSVVVMFNHLSDAHRGGGGRARCRARRGPAGRTRTWRNPDWLGAYLGPKTGLSARIDARRSGRSGCATAILPTCLSERGRLREQRQRAAAFPRWRALDGAAVENHNVAS